MGEFVRGNVVVIPFPFSDLSGNKRRPAFVVANVTGDDLIVCQITSRHQYDSFAVPVTAVDFTSGALPVDRFIRPNKLFTACKRIIHSTAGRLSGAKTAKALSAVVAVIIG
jgi:mRNA interferase MazF